MSRVPHHVTMLGLLCFGLSSCERGRAGTAQLRWAAAGWHEPTYRDLAQRIGGGTAMLDLTVP